MSAIGKILTRDAMTLVLPTLSHPYTMSREHRYFDDLLSAVKSKDIDAIMKVINLAEQVEEYSEGLVTVKNGKVLYEGERVSNAIADRILELYRMEEDWTFMARFLENLMLNPSYQSREELYLFLEECKMPITDDGRFLAYKWIDKNFKDTHSGQFNNTPGNVVSMPRSEVDDNRQHTCSSGLHVCSHKYTKFGTILVLVAVNPKDVVSVPYDYDNGKMRVCEYEVLREISEDKFSESYGQKPVHRVEKQPRDKHGRFMSNK